MSFLSAKSSKVFIAGHRGMVGSAITRRLQSLGFTNLILKSRQELDLTDSTAVKSFFQKEKPEYVFLAAARVGGIKANNDDKFGFLLDNMLIQNNVIRYAYESGTRKLLFLGSSCIYPKLAPQPIREDSLLTGPLEITNEGYALAKITGLKLCQYLNLEKALPYISAMPTNLYGPNDNFHPEKSHVIPGMIQKFHRALINNESFVTLWGTGSPRREFLYADDCADGLIHLMEHYTGPETVNLGCGEDITIKELAAQVAKTVGFKGEIRYDSNFPDGTPRKLLDVSRIHSLGWKAKVPLSEGLEKIYNWAKENKALTS